MSDTYTDSAADEVRRRFYAGQPPDPPPGQETSPTDPNASAPVDPHKRQLSPQSTANLPPPPPPPELPPPPHLYDMPRPDQYGMAPGQQQENPFAVFKNPMIWLGILGSLATRTPMLAAMGFATGAMDGYHQGNMDVFEQNKTKFNEAITAAQDQNRKELAQYEVSLDQLKQKNWSEIMPGLWTQAAANNDQNAMSVIKLGPAAWEKFVIQRASQQNALETALAKTQAEQNIKKRSDPKWIASPEGQEWVKTLSPELQKQYQGFVEQYGGGIVSESGKAPTGMSPQQFDTNADYYRLTGKLPQLGWGAQMNAAKLAIVNHANDRETQKIPIDGAAQRLASQQAGYQGTISGARAGGTRAVNIEMAANLATMAIPQALAASKEFPRGKFTPINAAKLKAYEAGSSVPLSRWDIANLQIVEMYARALNPQGQTIRQDMFNRAADVISQAKSPEAYEALLHSIYDAMLRERQGIGATQREISSGVQGTLPNPFEGSGAAGAFDREAAKKAGYSDDEIDEFLAKRGQ